MRMRTMQAKPRPARASLSPEARERLRPCGLLLAALCIAIATVQPARATAQVDAATPTPDAEAAAAELAGLEPPPAGLDARNLAERALRALRSDTTYMSARMIVTSPRLTSDRVVAFESWDDLPGKRSLIRIQSPSKDRGTGFLKLTPNLWMYVPRVERTVRIPPSMMLQSWMGSDFTNDDLVNESSELDDYEHALLGVDRRLGETGAHVLEYRPLERAAVVWGRIVAWLDAKTGTPLRQDFYDEDGERVRTMVFEDLRAQGGRHVPHRWQLTPLDKPGHRTVIEIDEFRFDVDIDEEIFTTRNLKKTG